MTARPKILMVDDREENLLALGQLLKEYDAEILAARSGTEALELLLTHDVALALLDVCMPRMDGFELAELMRGTARTRDIPIIFITAAGWDPSHVFKGYDVGAVAFLIKPFDPRVLGNKVRTFLRLHRQNEELAEARRRLQADVDELKRAQESLRRAARARERLVSLVSHDLRNPLAAMMMSVASLQRKLGDPRQGISEEQLATSLDRIARQGGRMTGLLNELLDVFQLNAGRPIALELQDTDLIALTRALVEEQQRAAPAHRIEVRASAGALVGRWDAQRLERVVGNLLSNAIKYSPGGGAVLVDIEEAPEGGAEDGTRWAVLRVKDEGIGIPAGDKERIFEWFVRGENVERTDIKGTGIGLAGARQIVERHGGSITVESEEGRGSTFTVRLPMGPPL